VIIGRKRKRRHPAAVEREGGGRVTFIVTHTFTTGACMYIENMNLKTSESGVAMNMRIEMPRGGIGRLKVERLIIVLSSCALKMFL
jgi:hypothetical protein